MYRHVSLFALAINPALAKIYLEYTAFQKPSNGRLWQRSV